MSSIGGLIPPVISPLTEQGRPDPVAIRAVTERMIGAGVDGLFVLGSCGQGPTLSDAQRQGIVEGFAAAIDGRVPLYMGVPDPGPERARRTLEITTAADVAAVVIGAPYYYVGAPASHVSEHVRRTIDDFDGEVVLYNIPQATGNALTPEVLEELAVDPRVIALKDSCGVAASSEALQATAQGAGLAFLQGAEALLLASLERGAAGIIPGIANVFPATSRALLDAVRSGDDGAAHRLQAEIDEQCSAVYAGGHWLAALHAAVARMMQFSTGLSGGIPALDAAEIEHQATSLSELTGAAHA